MFRDYFFIKKNQKISDFIEEFEIQKKNNKKIGIKISNNKKFEGMISLSDVRKLQKEKDQSEIIDKFINKKPIIVKDNELNNNLYQELQKRFKKNNVKSTSQVILVDQRNTFLKILDYKSLFNDYEYKNVCVIGLGHIGLPLIVHLLKSFKKIKGFDKDKKKINNLKKSKFEFYEKNLNTNLQNSLENKKIEISNDIRKSIAEVYIICLGSDLDGDKIDNKKLIDVAKNLAKILKKNDLVILRGTVPVGASRQIFLKTLSKNTKFKCGQDFYFSYLPERIVEGNSLEELTKIPQLISGYSENCLNQIKIFSNKAFNNILSLSSIEEGEIIKLASNSYRDLNFAFSNELARLANSYKLSGSKLIEKANYGYERNNIARPSLGVGGFCLPKDPFLFKKSLSKKVKGYKLADLSREINNDTIKFYGKKIIDKLKSIKKKQYKVLIMGLAFKGSPETIDTRNSPGLKLANFIKNYKIKIEFLDTMQKLIQKVFSPKKNYSFCINHKKINDYDMIIIINNHEYYLNIINNNLKTNKTIHKKYIFDCWNLLDKNNIINLNWNYLNL